MLRAEPWEDLDLYTDILHAVCQTYGRRVCIDPDELFSEVVLEKYPQVFRCWDPAKGPFVLHLKRSMRWYIHKYVTRSRHQSAAEIQESIPDHRQVEEGLALEVEEVLAALPLETAQLLRWRLMCGYTLAEIGQHLDVSPRWAGVLYNRALMEARAIWQQDGTT